MKKNLNIAYLNGASADALRKSVVSSGGSSDGGDNGNDGVEYIDISSLDSAKAKQIAMAAECVKWKTDIMFCIVPYGVYNSIDAIYLSIAINLNRKICTMGNVTDESQLEFFTIGEVMSKLFGIDFSSLPRISEEQFYSLE